MFYFTPSKPVTQMASSVNSNNSHVTAPEESWEVPWERGWSALFCPGPGVGVGVGVGRGNKKALGNGRWESRSIKPHILIILSSCQRAENSSRGISGDIRQFVYMWIPAISYPFPRNLKFGIRLYLIIPTLQQNLGFGSMIIQCTVWHGFWTLPFLSVCSANLGAQPSSMFESYEPPSPSSDHLLLYKGATQKEMGLVTFALWIRGTVTSYEKPVN